MRCNQRARAAEGAIDRSRLQTCPFRAAPFLVLLLTSLVLASLVRDRELNIESAHQFRAHYAAGNIEQLLTALLHPRPRRPPPEVTAAVGGVTR